MIIKFDFDFIKFDLIKFDFIKFVVVAIRIHKSSLLNYFCVIYIYLSFFLPHLQLNFIIKLKVNLNL